MSVQILSIDTYDKLTNSAKLINEALGGNFDFYDMAEYFTNLARLNVRSWNERYPGDVVPDERARIWFKPDICSNKHFNNHCELLKALKFLKYNIDIEEEDMGYYEITSMSFLNSAISGVTSHILYSIPEYRAAYWG